MIDGIGMAVTTLNVMAEQDMLAQSAFNALQFVRMKEGNVSVDDLQLHMMKLDISHKSIHGALNCLTYFFRMALRDELSSNMFENQLKMYGASSRTISDIQKVWSTYGETAAQSDALRHVLSIGKLLDIKWKVSIATECSSCNSLNEVLVTALLHVSDANGKESKHVIEMSYETFQNFTKELKAMESVLDTL